MQMYCVFCEVQTELLCHADEWVPSSWEHPNNNFKPSAQIPHTPPSAANRRPSVMACRPNRHCTVGTATCYRLEEPRFGSQQGHENLRLCTEWVPAFLGGLKRPGLGADHSTTTTVRVRKRVECLLYAPPI